MTLFRTLGYALLVALAFAATTTSVFAVGGLFVRPLNSNQEYAAMDILTYDATVRIDDHVALTHVDQTFRNNRSEMVEATLIFPLPAGAVITDMWYHFNGKRYHANVREKKEAQAAYDAKVRRVIDPALLQEIGDNLFKLNIAPINGNSFVRVEVTYTEILPFSLETTRYNHFLKTTGLSPKPLERMTLRLTATTSNRYGSVVAPGFENSTAYKVTQTDEQNVTVELGDEFYQPTKNFQLQLITKRSEVEIGTLTYVPTEADSFGVDPFFFTWVIPPSAGTTPLPKSVVFTADVSSSMAGKRVDQLRQALLYFLDNLSPNDRFNIVLFSTNAIPYSTKFVQANAENIEGAKEFVRTRSALGLTNISEALQTSLALDFLETTSNAVIFLTDGHPSWGEKDPNVIRNSVTTWNQSNASVYPITIGSESSVSLMKDIANLTNGFITQIDDDDSIVVQIEDHLRRISMPHLNNLALDYGLLDRYDVLPTELTSIQVGSRLIQTGRYETGGWYPVTLTGSISESPFSLSQDVLFGDLTRNNRAVARLWANYMIEELLDQIDRLGEQKELVDAVIDLSIRYGILTRYTALYSDPDEDDPDDGGDVTSAPNDERPLETISLSIAPHPATVESRLTIVFNTPIVDNPTVEVYDVHGQKIAEHVVYGITGNVVEIDLFELQQVWSAGAYTIVVRMGEIRVNKNIVVIGA